jgi:ABC-type transport system substrate-binding protein
MRKIGIDIVITVYEVGEWYRRNMDMSVATGVPDLLWLQPGHYPILTDPGYDTIGIQNEGTETGAFNTYGWNSTTQGLDPEGSGKNMWVKQHEMYEEVQAERDWDERVKKWQELNEYLLQYGPMVKLICSQFTSAYTDNVDNFFVSPLNIWPAIFWMTME